MLATALRQHIEIVKLLLLDKRVLPLALQTQIHVLQANDNYAVRKASYCGYTEVVKLLLLDERSNPY